MHPLHLERFYAEPVWQTFRAETKRAVEQAGAIYLDASTWIPDAALFDDNLHLSKQGATQFSGALAQNLVADSN